MNREKSNILVIEWNEMEFKTFFSFYLSENCLCLKVRMVENEIEILSTIAS